MSVLACFIIVYRYMF